MRKNKNQKIVSILKLTKLGKKLLKNRNLSNFKIKKNGLSFLTFKTRTFFNYLQLAFIEA